MDDVLIVACAAVIAFAVIMYVVMDGFDLGIGILFPLAPDDRGRTTMTNAIAPVWDGNETWLVLGGATLFAGFPTAYAILLPALYLPILAMLIALIFRGVAFEFRGRAQTSRIWWERAFHGGSLLATFAQGVVLGAFVQGVQSDETAFAGSALDWASPFALTCGLALVAGYALLGACWVVMKTDGELQKRARGWARRLLLAVLAGIAAVSVWTPLLNIDIAERWFAWPNVAFLSPVPLLTALIAFLLLRALSRGRELAPFLCAVGLFLLSYLGLGISLFPNIIPPETTIWAAAAAPSSLAFLLWGIAIVLPVVLGYTVWAYRVFRGKASAEDAYH